ncbi:hypothetical protein BGW80DRAFT_1299473 [Lactifluus volemus]|nr:hypothetical protein BGW80DRAFT_1299473 [Lactifluus volemus]
MSETSLPAPSASSPTSFQTIFCDALKRYCEKTQNDLLAHLLTADLQNCKNTNDILVVLDEKYKVRGFIHGQSQTSTRWLNATFTVLSSFSAAICDGVGLVFLPGKVIFAAIGVLLITARDVGADNDALVGIFARIEKFFKRLETYIKVPPTDAMRAQIIQILVVVIEVLAVVTRWIKWKFSKKFLKKLVGRTNIEDAMTKLDRLTQEEALMAHARSLELLLSVETKVDTVIDGENQARRS